MGGCLRIVFVAPFGLRHKTTVWARTLPLASELNRLGNHASIVVPPWDSPEDAGISEMRDGVHIEQVRVDGGILATSARLVDHIRGIEPDIVHVIKPRAYAGIVQWLLWQSRRLGVRTPKIFLDVDDWERPWAAINGYPWHQARFLQWQEEWGIRHADGIIAASRWLHENTRVVAPHIPALFLPNGVDAHHGAPARSYAPRTPPRILFLSRFVETSPQWLGQFWRALQREVDHVTMFVAGRALYPGGEKAALDRLLADHVKTLPANVAWLGFVKPNELPSLYDSVDLAVFPSDDTPLLRAKCSVRMANALQHGVPVVASAVGAQADYGDDGAASMLPPDCTPAEFAEETARVLGSMPVRQTYGERGQVRMRTQFAWSHFGRKLDEFYRRVQDDDAH